jgi:membrane protein required for colicin V production
MVDLILVILILFLSLKGFFNGLMRELVGFVGLIGGVFVASRAAVPLGQTIAQTLHAHSLALPKLGAFLLVLAIIWGGSAFVGNTFASLRTPPRSTLMHIGGMGVAAVKYLLIFSLIAASLLGSDLVRENLATQLHQSRLLPRLERTGAVLINLAPLPFTQTSPATKGTRP